LCSWAVFNGDNDEDDDNNSEEATEVNHRIIIEQEQHQRRWRRQCRSFVRWDNKADLRLLLSSVLRDEMPVVKFEMCRVSTLMLQND
jgi:hypothetical protein